MVVRIALVCGWLLWPLSAAAQPRLSWQAPQECPQHADAKQSIARALGRPWSSIESKLALRASIRGVNGAYEARIRIGAASAGERVLRDGDCEVLVRATGVVMALAIDERQEATLERDGPPSAGVTSQAEASQQISQPSAAAHPAPRTTDAPQPSAAEPTAGGSALAVAGVGARSSQVGGSQAQTNARSTPFASAAVATLAVRESQSDEPAASVALDADASDEAAEPDRAVPPRERGELAMRSGPPVPASMAQEAGVVLPHQPAAPSEPSTLQIAAAVAGSLTSGPLPKLAPGARVSVSLLGMGWRAGLHFGYALPQSGQLATVQRGGRIALASVGADAGPRFRAGPFEIPVVAGVETGFFDATGEAVDKSTPQRPIWLSTYLGSALSMLWGRTFAAGLWLEGIVPLLRPAFAVQPATREAQAFHRPASVGVRGFFELELRFQ